MPELPEVETIARQLDEVLSGQVIKSVEVRREKSFPHFAPSTSLRATRGKARIVGRKVVGVKRRAKMIIVVLGGEVSLLIHLKMTGQLIYQPQVTSDKQQDFGEIDFKNHKPHFRVGGRVVGGHPTADWVRELPSSHTRVIFKLSKGILFFNDSRVFGWVKVITNDELRIMNQGLPPDVVDRKFTVKYLSDMLARTRRAVKLVITHQMKMGGVGNIYANDALWEARIDPRRGAHTLENNEVERLYRAIQKVIQQGIRYGGATASDDKFVQATGLGGKYQEHFLVYDRAAERCLRRGCSGIVERVRLGGRGTFFCPRCQA